MIKNHKLILFFIILLLAAFFRFYGVNWDQGQHLHPDERFLTMVTDAIDWPVNFREYLDTNISPLNPHNRGFGFFVYGTFPIFFTKWVIGLLTKENYSNITIIGRYLSGIVDLGTVVLVFLIGRELVASSMHQVASKYKKLHTTYYILHTTFPLLAMFLYSIMVLPIQLSHFYAVDTYLTFFITLTFYFLIKIISLPDFNFLPPTKSRYSENLWGFKRFLLLNVLLGISFGLSLASKISAILFLPIIGLGLLFYLIKNRNLRLFFARPVASLLCFGVLCSLFLVFTYLTFRLAQPYLFANPNMLDFTLNQKVLDNWKQLKTFDNPTGWFPPAVQWITTKPYLFPLKNMLLWGLGLPLGIIALSAISYRLWVVGYELIKKKFNLLLTTYYLLLNLILIWILLLFSYQGTQFVKALRYFIPVYPFLAIISGFFIYKLMNYLSKIIKSPKVGLLFVICYLLFLLIYPLSFITIYSRPHTRVTASEWIYKNIPAGSIRSSEHWDDGLPLSLPQDYIHEKYPVLEFPLYGADTKEKWQEMGEKLKKVEYIILTSNRLYGAIMTFPERYPITFRYYQALFDGSLGFQKVAEFTSRPNIPLPFSFTLCLTPPFSRYGIIALKDQRCDLNGISFVDDYADETFTVYDHPKVIIFKKIKKVDYFNLLFKSTVMSSVY